MAHTQPTVLVTGASGQMGRQVVELLLESYDGQIIATSRTPDRLTDFRDRGVTLRQADFDNPDALPEAFAGAERLLLISTDKLGMPGGRIQQHTGAVHAAERAGVKHVLYTSTTRALDESPIFIAVDHRATELALMESTMGYTMLRNNTYTDMLLGTLNQAISQRKLFSAAGDGKVAYVTRDDCAQAAAAALAQPFDGRRVLDISGPESVSQADLAAIASDISGKHIEYVPISVEQAIESMVAAGLPRPTAESYASFDQGIALGLQDVVSNAVEELTGHAPTSVRDFLDSQREMLMG